MLSYAFSTATSYFHLPVDEEQDKDIASYRRKYITWTAEPSITSTKASSTSASPISLSQSEECIAKSERNRTVNQILSQDDLYEVLGVQKSPNLDKIALRRAYLSRSRECHPDKFPIDKANATLAFQKVAVAYDVLSKPSTKRLYDSRSPTSTYDVFAARPAGYADETFRSVVIGVFNDFLDGDLEVIRTLLKAINDINPSLKLGEDGIAAVIVTLQSVRERALTCRACIYALHAELARLLEVQYALRQLSYFDLIGRSRLTIQLTRITLSLPIALEKAIEEQNVSYGAASPAILPRQVTLLIRGADVALEKMERILKK